MRRDLADKRDVFFFHLAVISYANSTCKVKKGEDVDPGGYFRNFWVGMCRWDPGTLNLYQS